MNWYKFVYVCCLSLLMFEATHQDVINTTNIADVCAGASFVCGRCPQSACPECYPGGQAISQQQCCQQRSTVQALTAASIQASVYAIATAQAAAAVATKAIVGVAAAATSGAFVSVTESLSLNPSSANCNLSHEVYAYANGYSAAIAQAAGEAEGVAVATANASAAASASASAAAKLFATAESLINSTCCGFDLQTYQLAIIAGQYITNASMSVNAARDIAANAHNISGILQEAYASVNESASSFLNHTINNCCTSNLISQTANQTVARLVNVLNAGYELNTIVSYTSDQITAYGIDNNTLEMAATSVAATNTSECANYPAGCCLSDSSCCNQASVSMASQAIVDVLLSSSSIAQAYVDVAVETMAVVEVVSAALANATAAVVAATNVATTLSITRNSCYSVTVALDSSAVAQAKAVASSFAAAAAAATAVSNASSSAYSLALSTARGVALAQSAVLSFGVGCCEKPCCGSFNYNTYTNYTLSDSYSVYSCCDIIASYKYADSQKVAQISKDACSTAFKEVSEVSAIADSTGAADCTNMIRRITTSMKFLLNVVCCSTTTPATVTATKVVSTTKTATTVVKQPTSVANIINKIANMAGLVTPIKG